MGIVDDSSTGSMQERLQHRQARQNFDNHFQGRQNGNRDVAGSSSYGFVNTPSPVAAGPPRSKYANAIPK